MGKKSNKQRTSSAYEKMYGRALANYMRLAESQLNNPVTAKGMNIFLTARPSDDIVDFDDELAECRLKCDMDSLVAKLIYNAPGTAKRRKEFIVETRKRFASYLMGCDKSLPELPSAMTPEDCQEATMGIQAEVTTVGFVRACEEAFRKNLSEEDLRAWEAASAKLVMRIVDMAKQVLLYCETQLRQQTNALVMPLPTNFSEIQSIMASDANRLRSTLLRHPNDATLMSSVVRLYIASSLDAVCDGFSIAELFFAFISLKNKCQQTSDLHAILMRAAIFKMTGSITPYVDEALLDWYEERTEDEDEQITYFAFDAPVQIPKAIREQLDRDKPVYQAIKDMAQFIDGSSGAPKAPTVTEEYAAPRFLLSGVFDGGFDTPLRINPVRRDALETLGYSPQTAAALDSYLATAKYYETLSLEQAIVYRYKMLQAAREHQEEIEQYKKKANAGDIVQEQLRIANARASTAEADLSKARKENRTLAYNLEAAENTIEQQTEELRLLRKKLEDLEAATQNMDELLTEYHHMDDKMAATEAEDTAETDDDKDSQWPSEAGKGIKVVCYGGSDNWRKVLQQRFPHVVFHGPDEMPKEPEIVHADCVFVNTFVSTHKFFWIIQNVARRNKMTLHYFDSRGIRNCSEQMQKILTDL